MYSVVLVSTNIPHPQMHPKAVVISLFLNLGHSCANQEYSRSSWTSESAIIFMSGAWMTSIQGIHYTKLFSPLLQAQHIFRNIKVSREILEFNIHFEE